MDVAVNDQMICLRFVWNRVRLKKKQSDYPIRGAISGPARSMLLRQMESYVLDKKHVSD